MVANPSPTIGRSLEQQFLDPLGGIDDLDDDRDVHEAVLAPDVAEPLIGTEAQLDQEDRGTGEIHRAGRFDHRLVERLWCQRSLALR